MKTGKAENRTRYFHLTKEFITEYDLRDIPAHLNCARGWKGHQITSILVRYGRGKVFEPSSEVHPYFRKMIRDYIQMYPSPQINFRYNTYTKQGYSVDKFSEKWLNDYLAKYCD